MSFLLLFGFRLLADDLAVLRNGQRVAIAMVGEGPLCTAAVERISNKDVRLRTTQTTLECGTKGELLSVPRDRIYRLSISRIPMPGRAAIKASLAIGASVAAWKIPLSSRDPQTAYLLRGLIGFAAAGGWKIIPERREYVLLITCPSRMQCFSAAHKFPQENQLTPGGR